jgi:uncharacterized membrane-anchored protein YjiN (DUF445 family)
MSGQKRYRSAKRRADIVLSLSFAAAIAAYFWSRDPIGRVVFLLCEAAFVAGCADWFAISALFGEPFGFRVPILSRHTSIIPRQRRELALGLRELLESELLPIADVRKWIDETDLVELIATHIATEESVKRWTRAGADRLVREAASIDAAGVARSIHRIVIGFLKNTSLSSRLSGLLRHALGSPLGDEWIGKLLVKGRDALASPGFLEKLEESLRREIRGETQEKTGVAGKFWSALKKAAVDLGERAGAIDYGDLARKIRDELSSEAAAAAQGDHPLRRELRARVWEIADRLETDRVLIDAVENWKIELLGRVDLTGEIESIVARLADRLKDENGEAAEAVRRFFDEKILGWLTGMRDDPVRREAANAWMKSVSSGTIDRVYESLCDLVVTSFERHMPPQKLVEFVQDEVGDELHNLRIVSTIVGAFVGLAIALVNILV